MLSIACDWDIDVAKLFVATNYHFAPHKSFVYKNAANMLVSKQVVIFGIIQKLPV